MNDEQREALDVLSDAEELYEAKEADYGQSWKLVGQILAMILDHQGVETLEVPVEADALNQLGLFFRRGDKFCRQFNGVFALDEMNVDENLSETFEDSVNYAAMATELAESLGAKTTTTSSEENTAAYTIGGDEFYVVAMSSGRGSENELRLRCSRTGVEIDGTQSDIEEMAR